MGRTGLINSIISSTSDIDFSRKAYAIKGKAEEARISYEKGIAVAKTAFLEAQITADPQIMLLVEYTFLAQELQLCNVDDKDSLNSLTQAIQSFDDAFLALKVVGDKNLYQGAEKTYPPSRKYQVSGFPKDSFHTAFISHKTRLQNILRSPGIDPIEKNLLKQRLPNLSTAQGGYIEKQEKVLFNQDYIAW